MRIVVEKDIKLDYLDFDGRVFFRECSIHHIIDGSCVIILEQKIDLFEDYCEMFLDIVSYSQPSPIKLRRYETGRYKLELEKMP